MVIVNPITPILYFKRNLCYIYNMQFELDDALIDDILFHMENQEGDFLLDTQEGKVVSADNKNDDERFISLPGWNSGDGYRLMERFTAEIKNSLVRGELSRALDRNKGVFRAFRDILEQYPETEKMWHRFKDQKMKEEVINWYNSLREEWGLQPIGTEPEDNSSLVLEDFVLREATATDHEKAAALHKICIDEIKDKTACLIFEDTNCFVFPGDFCFAAENSGGEFAGYICAVKNSYGLHIHLLEVKAEYRGMGLGKTLLSKLVEKSGEQIITIDLPAGMEHFSRALHLEEFKPCMQKFILNKI